MAPSIEDFPIILKEFILKGITLNYFIFKKIIRKELKIKRGMKILDLGSGTGILSPLFSNANYVGIDLDKKLVEFSKRNYPYIFRKMDAQKLDFPNNSFNAVLIAGVVHHLSNKKTEKVFNGLKKTLKRNGKVLLIEAIPPIDRFNFFGKILRKMDEGHDIREFNDYSQMFKKHFRIKTAYKKRGGLVDYAVFVLEKTI